MPKYQESAARAALPDCRPCSVLPKRRDVAAHPAGMWYSICRELEALKSSKIDGVCLWLNEHSPVIGMTMRFDRMDNFWFVLRHELEHVLLGHGKVEPSLDVDLNEDVVDEEEEVGQCGRF